MAAYVEMGVICAAAPTSNVMLVHKCFVYTVYVKSFIPNCIKH